MIKKSVDDFVTIYLEGLMISCFNSSEKRFETAILRKLDHDFSVRIVKYEDGLQVSVDEFSEFPLEGLKFEIEGKGNLEVDGFQKFEPDSFKREDGEANDINDLRWLIDMEGEELHNEKLLPTGESVSKHNMSLTPLFIKNAEFFVSGITDYENYLVEKDENENTINQEYYGKYGFVMGARINADSVSLDYIGSDISFDEMKREDGFTYKIFVTNTREGGDEESELPVYYKVVRHLSGKHFTLEKRTDAEVELYWRSGNCGKVLLGRTTTIENLT